MVPCKRRKAKEISTVLNDSTGVIDDMWEKERSPTNSAKGNRRNNVSLLLRCACLVPRVKRGVAGKAKYGAKGARTGESKERIYRV